MAKVILKEINYIVTKLDVILIFKKSICTLDLKNVISSNYDDNIKNAIIKFTYQINQL
jgi:hypothetical protein